MRLLSKVIKASQYGSFVPADPAGIFGADDGAAAGTAEDRGREMLDQAFRKAKEIVDAAQIYRMEQLRDCAARIDGEMREARKQGYEEGFAKGQEEGKNQGFQAGLRQGSAEGARSAVAENRKHVDELARMIEAVEKSKSTILSEFESGLEELAVSIARAILKRELKLDPKTMHSIIVGAMDSYRNQEWVRIYVSGSTANLLLKSDAKIADELRNISDNVKIVVAEGMGDGGCILEMPTRVIDAGVDAQLDKIRAGLDEAVRSES